MGERERLKWFVSYQLLVSVRHLNLQGRFFPATIKSTNHQPWAENAQSLVNVLQLDLLELLLVPDEPCGGAGRASLLNRGTEKMYLYREVRNHVSPRE